MDERIRSVFAGVFNGAALGPETSVETLEGWDSLNHVNLVLALEEQFRVRFSLGEIVELTSVGKIQECLRLKGALE